MKAKYSLILLLVVLFTSAYSSGDKSSFKRVYIGFSATPDFSFRYLHGNPEALSGPNSQTLIGANNTRSFPEIGANVSFRVGINLTRWLAIEGGVGYSLLRYRYSSYQFYPSGNLIPGDSFKIAVNEEYHYMTVPVGLRFSMGHKKVRGVIAAGVDFDFLVKQIANSSYTYAGGLAETSQTTVQTSNFNMFNVSPYLGVGIDCYLSPAVVLRLMPVAQIQALKAINTQTQEEYLVNLGLNLSFLFGL